MRFISVALIIGITLWPLQAFAISPITLTGSLDKSKHHEGEQVVLSLALCNGSAGSLLIGGTAFESSSFSITITNDRGQKVPRTAFGNRKLTPPIAVSRNETVSLDSGHARHYRFNLARLFDLSRPGDYTVSVSRFLPQFVLPHLAQSLQTVDTTLTAGPFTIHMTEDASTRSGPTALTQKPAHNCFLFIANQYQGAVSRLRIEADGKPSPTIDTPASAEEGSEAVVTTPDGKFLYIGNGSLSPDHGVSQFRVGANGELTPLSPLTVSAEKYPSFLLMDPKGRFLYAMSGWGVTLYAIGPDGRLTENGRKSNEVGASLGDPGVIPMYFGAIDPTGTFLYGIDGESYKLAADGRIIASAPPSGNPRGPGDGSLTIALSPSGKMAFLLTVQDTSTSSEPYPPARVVTMRVGSDGHLIGLPDAKTAPAPPDLTLGNTRMVVDPTGRFLLLFSTVPSQIARYRIAADGSVTALGMTPEEGQPIAMMFGPDSHIVYVLNRYYNSVSTFRLDDQGSLTKVGPDAPNMGAFVADFTMANAPTPQAWGPTASGLAVSAQIERDILSVQSPVILTAVLKNTTNHPLSLGTEGTDLSAFHLALTAPEQQSGRLINSSEEPWTDPGSLLAAGQDLQNKLDPANAPLMLPPGGQRQYRFILSRLSDLTLTGTYTVQVNRLLPSGSSASSPILRFQLDDPREGQSDYAPRDLSKKRDAEPSVDIL